MNRSELSSRVKALLSKTTENGATEAEAMSAASKAKELMDKYQLDLGAVGLEEEGTGKYKQPSETGPVGRQQLETKVALMLNIMRYTGTRGWHSGFDSITYFGLKSDTDFAIWLSDSLSAFCINQATAYRLEAILFGDGKLTRDGFESFLHGAVERINQRLKEMTSTNVTGTGRDLIPLKNQIVARDYAKLDLRLHPSNVGIRSGADANASAAGRAAGDRASFGRPITTRVAGLLGGR